PLTADWVNEYALDWTPPQAARGRSVASRVGATSSARKIEPNAMQFAALNSIKTLREGGARRGLVISATGTGKTILAALDVRAADPRRVLFVAHREQILDRAIDEFRLVIGNDHDDYGKVAGSKK